VTDQPTPLQFLQLLYKGATPPAGFVEFRFLKGAQRAWMPWPAFEGHPDEFHLADAPKGKNIYFGVSIRTQDAPSAISPKTGLAGMGDKAHCHPTHLCWTEVDLKDHPDLTGGLSDAGLHEAPAEELAEYKAALLERVIATGTGLNLPPRAVVDSGHGLHVYFARRIRSTPEDTERFNRALSRAFGGGTESTDVSRILRVPGSVNLKNPARPLPVTLRWQDADACVEEAALEALLPAAEPPRAQPAPARPTLPDAGASTRERYAQAALVRELDALSGTGEGGRNDQLNRSAFSLGTLIGAGLLDEQQAIVELEAAARAAGLEETEIRDTIRSGIDGGKAHPRDVSEIGQPRPTAAGTIGKTGGQAAKPTRTADLPEKPTLAQYRDLMLDWCAEHGHIYRYHQTRRSWWRYYGGVYLEVIDEVIYQRTDKTLQEFGYTNLKTALLREVLDKISREDSVASLEVDQTAWELNTRSGILDLASGQLREHTPEYFSTIQSAAHYRPGAVAHDWLAFLDEAVPDRADRLLLQQFAGLCLTGDTSPQRALLLVGDGGTGKSTFVRVLQAVLGNLATSSALESIKDDSFLIGRLVGKRMCVVSELQRNVDWLPFKRITGEDMIGVDVKNKTPYTVKLDIKLIILSNVVPFLGDDTTNTSLMRRFLPVAFNVKPAEPDPTLEARLTDPEELPGVLNWMLEGLASLRAAGMRFPTGTSGPLAREIVEESNRVIGFLRDITEPKGEVAGADLYKAYSAWCYTNNNKPLNNNNFAKQLLAAAKHFGHPIEKRRLTAGVSYVGVRVSDHPGGWEDEQM